MPVHKCNKCFHQAYVKTEFGNEEFCLIYDKALKLKVKTCSEFCSVDKIQEPDDFTEELDKLFEKPSLRKLNAIKKKVAALRKYAHQNNKPRIRK